MKGVLVGKGSAGMGVCWLSLWFLTRDDRIPCGVNVAYRYQNCQYACVCDDAGTVVTTDFQVVQFCVLDRCKKLQELGRQGVNATTLLASTADLS